MYFIFLAQNLNIVKRMVLSWTSNIEPAPVKPSYLPFISEPRRESFGTNSGWNQDTYAVGADAGKASGGTSWDPGTYSIRETNLDDAAYEEPVPINDDGAYATSGPMSSSGMPMASEYSDSGLDAIANEAYDAFANEEDGLYEEAGRGLARQQVLSHGQGPAWSQQAYATGADNHSGAGAAGWDADEYATGGNPEV